MVVVVVVVVVLLLLLLPRKTKIVVVVSRSYRGPQNSFSVSKQNKTRRADRRKAEQDET